MLLHPRQLEAFQAVMRAGSMTGAAELMRVTQPAVSRLVRELEASLGMTLFQRSGSRIAPTHDAVQLQIEVERHFVGLGRIARAADEIRNARKGTIRVGAIAALSIGILNQVIHDFMAARPEVRIRLHTDTSPNVAQMVAMHQVDVGFTGPVRDAPGVRVQPLPEAAAVCVVPARHPLARRDVVECEDLRGRALVNLAPENPLRQRLDALLLTRGVHYRQVVETSLAASVGALVGLRLGIAVADPFTMHYLPRSGVAVRPFLPRLPVQYSALLPAHQAQRRLVLELCREVARCMQDLPRSWAPRRGGRGAVPAPRA
jgi:DNA-binding transcriptional LysR family regulator